MDKQPLHHGKRPRPSLTRSRALLVALRWVLAVAWAAIVFAAPEEPGTLATVLGAAAYLILSFLLANALWQHMPLKAACAAAFIGAALVASFGVVIFLTEPTTAGGLMHLIAAMCGAAVGSLVAYPLLQRIDRLVSPR